jgi:hypothetical protein
MSSHHDGPVCGRQPTIRIRQGVQDGFGVSSGAALRAGVAETQVVPLIFVLLSLEFMPRRRSL